MRVICVPAGFEFSAARGLSVPESERAFLWCAVLARESGVEGTSIWASLGGDLRGGLGQTWEEAAHLTSILQLGPRGIASWAGGAGHGPLR